MLKMLGKDEVDSALTELGELAIDCDFCGRHYAFDAVDCKQLFASEVITQAVQLPGELPH
jgi:molecular chaperone Hsp33